MILLDTNVISEPLNERPNRRVIAWMRSRRPETLFLSVITVAELRTGVAMMPEGKRRKNLHDNLEQWLLPRFLGRILPFDLDCTPFLAEIMAQARRTGRAVALADGYIATRDIAPFLAAGVPVVNPWLE